MLRFVTMWIVFVILIFIGVLGLELVEGMKIGASEYYGLRNVREVYFLIIFTEYCLPYSLVYLFIVSPLSIILRKNTSVMLVIRITVFTILGAIGGKLLFPSYFLEHIIEWFDLKELTAIVSFGACGLAYSLIDTYFIKKTGWARRFNSTYSGKSKSL